MPLDETSSTVNPAGAAEPAPWLPLDRRLIEGGATREAPPSFPLHLLPERWRAWVAASAQSFTPVDYLGQGLLAAASAVCGGGLRVRVSAAWAEPLVLWQALVGPPSTGKTPALAASRRLLDGLEPELLLQNEDFLHGMVFPLQGGERRGAVLWRDDLASWLEPASRGRNRSDWLVGWNAREADSRAPRHWSASSPSFALSVVGALRPERLAASLGDEELAARFLFAWPEATACAPLDGPLPDAAAVGALLQRIARLAASSEHPSTLPLQSDAVAALERLLPALRAEMQSADGAEAAWIGKGPGTIVRLAGLLALMRWAETDARLPDDIDAATLADAHALWVGYFLPHARAVFGQAGIDGRDRLARRAARWLRRSRLSRVSREDIRRDALSCCVNAEQTDHVIERLEEGGVLRVRVAERVGSRGPARRRWEINPLLL